MVKIIFFINKMFVNKVNKKKTVIFPLKLPMKFVGFLSQ